MHHSDGLKFVHTGEMELIVDKLVKLLPAASRELKEIGRLEEWVSFVMLVNKGDFNFNNITTQLFLDIVKHTCHGIYRWCQKCLDNRISIIP